MSDQFTPVSIEVFNTDQYLEISWKDGHITKLSLFGLRKNCPCVMCRGGHDKMGQFEPALFRVEPTRIYKIDSAEAVGNHALKINWDDGHNSGMYRWELIRKMDEAALKLDNQD